MRCVEVEVEGLNPMGSLGTLRPLIINGTLAPILLVDGNNNGLREKGKGNSPEPAILPASYGTA